MTILNREEALVELDRFALYAPRDIVKKVNTIKDDNSLTFAINERGALHVVVTLSEIYNAVDYCGRAWVPVVKKRENTMSFMLLGNYLEDGMPIACTQEDMQRYATELNEKGALPEVCSKCGKTFIKYPKSSSTICGACSASNCGLS